jgi:hypothetical protein
MFMAIDYVIDYDCVPKQTLGTDGILERIKGQARADNVIRLFRVEGDQRPPSEMGFEFSRSLPDGTEETRIVLVQEMLDQAAELQPLALYCEGCPANALGRPFGCMGQIQYPISSSAEGWLLDQLPSPEEALVWLLLRQSVQEMGYDGEPVRPLRANETYFEERKLRGRNLVEFVFSADQVFEMLFLLGHIQPPHAGMLLLFFNAIPRDVEASQIVQMMNGTLTADEIAQQFPFQLKPAAHDDTTTAELKQFFSALYRAWALNLPLLLDV